MKRAKRWIRYGLVRGALFLVSLLPARLASAVGAAFGALAYRLAWGERSKARRSLARAFPELGEGQRESIVRGMFRHLGRCAFELACIRQLDAQLDDWVDWPKADRDVLTAALSRGRGVLFISGHVGNWELLARTVAKAGFPCQTIAKETTDPRLTALVERFRASAGLRSIWRGQDGAAKQMLRALRSGEVLGMLIDQDTRVQSVFVPFFGQLAATPRAAGDLAYRTGAAVLLGFCQRIEGKYRLSLREVPLPSSSASGGDGEAIVLELTRRLSEGIELAIRSTPEQWVWMHQRWKTAPAQKT